MFLWYDIMIFLNAFPCVPSIFNPCSPLSTDETLSPTPFAGNGLWHHHVLGRQQCGSAEGALCVPFDRRWQTGSAHQLYGGQSNVRLAGGLLH